MRNLFVILWLCLFALTFTPSYGAVNIVNYTTADGLLSNRMTDLAFDSEGTLWAGGGLFGGDLGLYVSKYDGNTWTVTEIDSSIGAFETLVGQVYWIYQGAEGSVWIISAVGGFHHLSRNGVVTYGELPGVPNDPRMGSFNGFAVDPEGATWFTLNKGLVKYEGVDWVYFPAPALPLHDYYRGLAIDSMGNKWTWTNAGLSWFDGLNWHDQPLEGRLANSLIRDLAIDPEDNLWLVTVSLTGSFLSKFDGINWTTVRCPHGSTFLFDSQGNKWFTTNGAGVWKFDGTSWTRYTTADGLAHDIVFNMAIDAEGNKWFATANGISRLEAGDNQEPGPVRECDFNKDGRPNVADVIALLLLARDNPHDPRVDWDLDGEYTTEDVRALLSDILYGPCPDVSALLAATGAAGPVTKIEGLSSADIEYVIRIIERLELTPTEETAFRLALFGEAGKANLPAACTLSQNSPNPFNPATSINYSVPEGAATYVSLEVFDMRGRLVRRLVEGIRETGNFTVFWDGTDISGNRVSSGVYLYRLRAGDFTQTRKMVLLK